MCTLFHKKKPTFLISNLIGNPSATFVSLSTTDLFTVELELFYLFIYLFFIYLFIYNDDGFVNRQTKVEKIKKLFLESNRFAS